MNWLENINWWEGTNRLEGISDPWWPPSWLQTPPTGPRTGPKKSFHRSGPWVISYRSNHKSPQSVNPMKSSSEAYGQTENTLKMSLYSFGMGSILGNQKYFWNPLTKCIWKHRKVFFNVIDKVWIPTQNSNIKICCLFKIVCLYIKIR
jgi:hypothetical protein